MHGSSRRLAKVRSGERRYVSRRKGACIEKACWMLVRKEYKGKYHSLIFKVWNWQNLNDAWEKVKRNRGAGGVDDVSIEEFERNLVQNLNEIQRLLRQDRYVPHPVKRVYIPKPDGKRSIYPIPKRVNGAVGTVR